MTCEERSLFWDPNDIVVVHTAYEIAHPLDLEPYFIQNLPTYLGDCENQAFPEIPWLLWKFRKCLSN